MSKSIFLVSRLSGHRPATADAVMSSSFHGTSMTSSHHESQIVEMTKSLIENFTNDNVMTQSLDPTILLGSSNLTSPMNNSMTSSVHDPHPISMNNGNLYNEQSAIPIIHSSGPLLTNSKMMPVPESLMSPDCVGPPIIPQQKPVSTLASSMSSNYSTSMARNVKHNQIQRPSTAPASKGARSIKKPEKSSPSNSPRKAIANTTNSKIHQNQSILKHTVHHQHEVPTNEDDDDDSTSAGKLKSTRKQTQKSQKQLQNSHQLEQKPPTHQDIEKSAVIIQKLWRGYQTRKKTVRDIAESLHQKRTQEYIRKLTKDMDMTKQALENERKIQQLQM